MSFVDEVKIIVHSGSGGKGCISFLRERFRPKGGPNGGDGGKGGDVILEATSRMHSLLDFKYKRNHKAQNGAHGQGSDKHGKNAQDLVLYVPLGTRVTDDETGEELGDLIVEGSRLTVAPGGRGGKGNARFATSTRQAPRFALPPQEGVKKSLYLELKLLADVGLLGLPNAGKSTLLTRLSAARPRIAPFPFTTINPHLGVLETEDHERIVIADIPGLIEGAHAGAGMGTRFLRHVERTRILLGMLDMNPESGSDPLEDLKVLKEEITLFNPELKDRLRMVALNKTDLPGAMERADEVKAVLAAEGMRVLKISALNGEGLEDLVDALFEEAGATRSDEEDETVQPRTIGPGGNRTNEAKTDE